MLDFFFSQQSEWRESTVASSSPFLSQSVLFLRLQQRRLAAQCCQIGMSLPYFRSRVRHSLGSPGVPGRLESRHPLKTSMSQKFTNSLLGTFMKTFLFLNLIYLWNLKKASTVHMRKYETGCQGLVCWREVQRH